MRSSSIALLALLSLALPGCKPSDVTVTGTVAYRERIALPDDAVVTVAIEDVSRADAAGAVIGSVEIHPKGSQPPIPFKITPAAPEAIDARATYALRARITAADGTLLWTNDTRYPVISNGVLQANVIVKRVAAN